MGNDPSTARALALFNFAAQAGGRAAGKRPPHLRRAGRGASPPLSAPLSPRPRARPRELAPQRACRRWPGRRRAAGGAWAPTSEGTRRQPRAASGADRARAARRARGGRSTVGGEGSAGRAGRRLASATVPGDEADARSPAYAPLRARGPGVRQWILTGAIDPPPRRLLFSGSLGQAGERQRRAWRRASRGGRVRFRGQCWRPAAPAWRGGRARGGWSCVSRRVGGGGAGGEGRAARCSSRRAAPVASHQGLHALAVDEAPEREKVGGVGGCGGHGGAPKSLSQSRARAPSPRPTPCLHPARLTARPPCTRASRPPELCAQSC